MIYCLTYDQTPVVMISSTARDLPEHRDEVMHARCLQFLVQGGRTMMREMVALGIILLSGCVPDDTVTEPVGGQEDAILRGKVTIGPLCPVSPCDVPPEQIAKVYGARKVIIYDQATQAKLAETNLSADGEYSFSLPPGSYIVDVSDGRGNALPLDLLHRTSIGNTAPKEARLQAGKPVVVDFDIDTGIR